MSTNRPGAIDPLAGGDPTNRLSTYSMKPSDGNPNYRFSQHKTIERDPTGRISSQRLPISEVRPSSRPPVPI